MSTIDSVLREVNQFEGDAEDQFQALARSIHAGEKPDTEDVVRVLRLADKTKDQLAGLVRTLQRRDNLRADIEETKNLAERNGELRQLIEEENKTLETAVAAHQAATRPLQYEMQVNQNRQLQLMNAERELFESCKSDPLRARLDSIMWQRKQNDQKQREARNNLHRAEAEVGGHDYVHFPDSKTKIDSWVKRAEQAVADLEKEAAELVRKNDAAVKAMRDW